MISWAVVGHHARIVAATDLARQVGGVVAMDDGTFGAARNHLRAWAETCTLDAGWCGVLEDDAEPVDGFTEQAELALAAAPEPIVSFYLGQTRPHRWNRERIPPAIRRADRHGAHWLVSTHVLHAVAIAMCTQLRDDWLDWAHASKLPIDERLTAWAIARDHKVAYAWPSLVDHADGPTLVAHAPTTVTGPRRAWRTGTREHWTPAFTSM